MRFGHEDWTSAFENMKLSTTNHRNESVIDTDHDELVSLSLGTQIVCPVDSSHVFPLIEGLSQASLEGLRDQERAKRAAIRAELEVAVEKKISEQIAQREKSLLEKETALRNLLEEKTACLSKVELENIKLKADAAEAADKQKVEVARALAEQREGDRKEMADTLRQALEAEYQQERERNRLRMLEVEKQRADAEKTAEDLRRRIAQGSQQNQGESLEVDLENSLREQFPLDSIEEVGKGVSGADVVWQIQTREGRKAGIVAVEVKNAKTFSRAWIQKAKEDSLRVSADIPVIVSTALPPEVRNFGIVDGVWVTNTSCWPALATALRGQLLNVHQIRVTNKAKDERLEALYQYLCSPDFRGRVELTVGKIIEMQTQLEQEKRALNKHWSKRQKLLQAVSENVSCIYGDLQGTLGSHELEEIEALSLGSETDKD